MRAYLINMAVIIGILLPPIVGSAAEVRISAEQWSIPRSAKRILEIDGLRSIVQQFNKHPDRGLIIYHPFGDEGTLWAEEMRSWLVALGIPSANLAIELDSGIKNELRIEYNKRGVL